MKESMAEFIRRKQAEELRDLRPLLERLTRPNPLLVDLPYVGPPAFLDPLEQLELGRCA